MCSLWLKVSRTRRSNTNPSTRLHSSVEKGEILCHGCGAHGGLLAKDRSDSLRLSPSVSVPFPAPKSMAALTTLPCTYGCQLWGVESPADPCTIAVNWFSSAFPALVHTTVVGMIELYRTQMIWNRPESSQWAVPSLALLAHRPKAAFSATLVERTACLWSFERNRS